MHAAVQQLQTTSRFSDTSLVDMRRGCGLLAARIITTAVDSYRKAETHARASVLSCSMWEMFSFCHIAGSARFPSRHQPPQGMAPSAVGVPPHLPVTCGGSRGGFPPETACSSCCSSCQGCAGCPGGSPPRRQQGRLLNRRALGCRTSPEVGWCSR